MTSPIGFRSRSGGTAAVPNLPTPPTGFAVAAYPTYASAQAAVEHLIKHNFSVQDVTIVGSDLQLVERVTGPTLSPCAWQAPFGSTVLPAEARRQVAAENGQVGRSTRTSCRRWRR